MQRTGYRFVSRHWGSPQLPTKRVVVVLSCGYGKTSWEIPGHFACWSQSVVSFWSRAAPRLGSSSSVCVMGLTARATKLKFRRGDVVPPHSSGAHVRSLYRSWCYAMPMRGWERSPCRAPGPLSASHVARPAQRPCQAFRNVVFQDTVARD